MIDRLLHLVIPFSLCLLLVIALRHYELGISGIGPQSTTLAIGFLLISAFLGGKIAPAIRLPRISGYLIVGLVASPYVNVNFVILPTEQPRRSRSPAGGILSHTGKSAGNAGASW